MVVDDCSVAGKMVEAAGVEPASETTQRQRLRVCPMVDFPGQAYGHA